MAYTAIDDPSAYFKVQLYSGDGTAIGSGGQAITFDDTDTDMQPDLVWVKSRTDSQNHNVSDSVRGGTKTLYANSSYFEETKTEAIASFQSDGFTVGDWEQVNDSGDTFVAWNWNTQGGAGSSNTAGSINTTTTSVGTTQGFSMSTYTGNDAAGATIGHGLGAVPGLIIIKCRDASQSWCVYHHKNTAAPETDYLILDTNAATADNVNRWNDTAPTSTLITLGDENQVNGSQTYVAYAFTGKQGYSKFGGYTGNGDVDGVFNYTGFRPAYLVIKRTDGVESWLMLDNKRDPYNPAINYFLANSANAETTGNPSIDFCANGFKMRDDDRNESGAEYVYIAFAESPFVNSEGVPTNAR